MDKKPDETQAPDLEEFLDSAEKALPKEAFEGAKEPLGAPGHRRLRVQVSNDRLDAGFDALFPATTWEEAQDALKQARVVFGIDEKNIRAAIAKAKTIGRAQRKVRAARGKAAEYKARQEVSYPFLEGRYMPDTGDPVHIASSLLRDIVEVHRYDTIERIRAYAQPVVPVARDTELMVVQGKDEIIPGQDVFGQPVTMVLEEGQGALKAGDGARELPDGGIVADRYGYVAVQSRFLMVLSPVWISPDGMDAYFFNPPALGEHPVPTVEMVLSLLEEAGIRFGLDEKEVATMCRDLESGALRESCVRLARGKKPSLARGQMQFHFELLPPLRFERIQKLLQSTPLPDVSACEDKVVAAAAGDVLGEQVAEGEGAGPGRDVFDRPVPLPETARKKVYKAGPNVRREVRDGRVFFVSEIYGYPGILDDAVRVLTPVWISPDRMQVLFVALPQEKPLWPSEQALRDLLERARVRVGEKEEVVAQFEKHIKGASGLVCLAEGVAPVPGEDGRVELLFKKMPDPGKLLESGGMDFRERESIPQAKAGDLLARRTLPKPGKSGRDVRGRLVQPPRPERELLYAGPQVSLEESDGVQLFYASGVGWARVVKDTLSVQPRFRRQGDVDYTIGNIDMEGDVEIEGSVKSRFRVEATGDVLISGGVESRAEVVAGGHVVVKLGIVGAKVRAGGNLFARFAQNAEMDVEGDLLVRNYLQNSQVKVQGRAIVQGNEGGMRQLCLLGGALQAGKGVEAASLGAAYGRATQVVVGQNLEIDREITRYRKGLAFADMQIRRAKRGLEWLDREDPARQLQSLSAEEKKAALGRMEKLQQLRALKNSLEFHIAEYQKARAETLKQAQVRVLGSAFAKTTIQINDRHITLEEEVQGLVFRLNAALNAIAREPLG